MRFIQKIRVLSGLLVTFILIILTTGWLSNINLLRSNSLAYNEGVQLAETIDLARQAQVAFQRQVQEWKNVLLRSHSPEMNVKYFKGFEQQEKNMNESLHLLKERLIKVGLSEYVGDIDPLIYAHNDMGKKYRQALLSYPPTQYTHQKKVDDLVRGIDRTTSAGLDRLVENLQREVTKQFEDRKQNTQRETLAKLKLYSLVIVMVCLVFIVLFIWVAQKVLRTLGAEPEVAVAVAHSFSRGDLTEDINATLPNSLLGSLEMFQHKVRNIILAIQEVCSVIEARSKELPAGDEKQQLELQVQRLSKALGRVKVTRGQQ